MWTTPWPARYETASLDHAFAPANLQANAEYAYRVQVAADGTWTNSAYSQYKWFATKSAPSSVEITNLTDGQGVTSISDVIVRASDAVHRFSTYGITNVELYIDGTPVESYDLYASGSYVDYTFHAGSLNLAGGVHQLDAIAYDDFWQETHQRIQVRIGPGGMLSMAVQSNDARPLDSEDSSSGTSRELRKAQTVQAHVRMAYRAGPYILRGKIKGSAGFLYLTVGDRRFHWRAESGVSMKEWTDTGTMPRGTGWRTAPHDRVGRRVEGESKPKYGAYLIHVSAAKVQDWPTKRKREAFHIHGNWGPPFSRKGPQGEKIPIDGEVFWHQSEGCIILHRDDLVDLKDRWETYVLRGAEHGPASVGIPMKVKYSTSPFGTP